MTLFLLLSASRDTRNMGSWFARGGPKLRASALSGLTFEAIVRLRKHHAKSPALLTVTLAAGEGS